MEGVEYKGEKLIDFGVLKRSHLRWGVIAQFFYNGGQTAINLSLIHIFSPVIHPYFAYKRKSVYRSIPCLSLIHISRILKFNKDKADENIARIKEQIEEINNHLAHIVEYRCV